MRVAAGFLEPMLLDSPMEAFVDQLAHRLRSFLSFLVYLGPPGPRAIDLEPDTDLERYLFCRDSRASFGPPRR